MEPDQIFDEVIVPLRTKVVDKIFSYLTGTLEGYDNIHQIVEEGLWEAYDSGVYTKVIVIENLSELQEAIEKGILEHYEKENNE